MFFKYDGKYLDESILGQHIFIEGTVKQKDDTKIMYLKTINDKYISFGISIKYPSIYSVTLTDNREQYFHHTNNSLLIRQNNKLSYEEYPENIYVLYYSVEWAKLVLLNRKYMRETL